MNREIKISIRLNDNEYDIIYGQYENKKHGRYWYRFSDYIRETLLESAQRSKCPTKSILSDTTCEYKGG